MKVAVTGATGFTGGHLVRELARRGHTVTALVRGSSTLASIQKYITEAHTCDLTDASSLVPFLANAEALINVVTLGTGLGPSLVEAAQEAGVARVVFTSTTGIFTTLNPSSKAIRLAAEKTISESTLDYTILRPTMIYGTPADRNMWRLVSWINDHRFAPVVGSGNRKQQPVHVDDLSWALVEAAESPNAARKAYSISGQTVLSLRDVIDTIAGHLQKKVMKLPVPLWPAVAAVRAVERLGFRSPVKSEQLLRLNEDKVFPHEDAARDFGYAPRSFSDGIGAEIEFLRMRD